MRVPLFGPGMVIVGYTLIDDEDAEFVNQWSWRMLPKLYVCRSDGARRTVYLHRALLGLERGDRRQADHINRDRLDNRRSNLRIVTAAQNRQNVRATGGYSVFRGVTFHRGERKWQAQAQLNGKHTTIGRFSTEEAAAAAAAAWRREHMPFSEDAVDMTAPYPFKREHR